MKVKPSDYKLYQDQNPHKFEKGKSDFWTRLAHWMNFRRLTGRWYFVAQAKIRQASIRTAKHFRTRHLFHSVNLSPWPILSSLSLFLVVSGLAFYLHEIERAGSFLLFGIASLSYCAYYWFSDIIDEATRAGYHTHVVRRGLKAGFWLFIVSEGMLFFGFFWAFFHSALSPAIEIGSVYPPRGIIIIPTLGVPLSNTALLIISGLTVTWSHYSLAKNNMMEAMDGLILTIVLGLYPVILQLLEYYETYYSFSDGIYACTFYMLTGSHGCHVMAGATFLIVCFLRLVKRHFLQNHYGGFVYAIRYWHFVDAIWIFLYLTVYGWGNW